MKRRNFLKMLGAVLPASLLPVVVEKEEKPRQEFKPSQWGKSFHQDPKCDDLELAASLPGKSFHHLGGIQPHKMVVPPSLEEEYRKLVPGEGESWSNMPSPRGPNRDDVIKAAEKLKKAMWRDVESLDLEAYKKTLERIYE